MSTRTLAIALTLASCGFVHASPDGAVKPAEDGFRYSESGVFDFTTRPLTRKDVTVDFKSTIDIEPNLSVLAKNVLPESSKTNLAELEQAAELARNLNKLVERWHTVGNKLAGLSKIKDRLTPAQIETLQQELLTESADRGKVQDAIEKYAMEMAKKKAGLTDEGSPRVLSEFETITTPLLTNAAGEPVIINPERVAALFEEALQNYIRDSTALTKSATLVRIRAFLLTTDKQRLPIHVDNYDEIQNPDRVQEDRITYGTEAERALATQEYQAAVTISDFINNAKDKAKTFQLSLQADLSALKGKYESLETALDKISTNGNLWSDLTKSIASLKSSGTPEQQSAITKLEVEISSLPPVYKTTVEKLKAASQQTDPVLATMDFIAVAKTIGPVLKSLQTSVDGISVLSVIAKKRLEASAADASTAELKDWGEKLLPNSSKALRDTLGSLSTLAPLLARLSSSDLGIQVTASAADVDTSAIKPQPLVNTPNAHINLVNLANRNDKIEVRTDLINAETGKTVQSYPARVFEVEKFGLSDDLSGSVIFVNRRNGGTGASFVAAPAVSWTLHYRKPKLGFWHTLDLGYGLNTAALNFDNSGVQVGVGAHLSLFQNMVLVGYGYNLNASSKNSYFFVGIGLFEALKKGTGLFK